MSSHCCVRSGGPSAYARDTQLISPCLLRAGTGEVESHIELARELRNLSIRHLACAPDGQTVFGCQFKGDPLHVVPLVGVLTPKGETFFLDMPEDDLVSMENYIGSVSLDRSGEIIAATSPRGSIVAFWDRASRRYLGRRRMSDICGVSPAPDNGTFLVTSGNAGVGMTRMDRGSIERIGGDLDRWTWDNHALSLTL